MNRILIFADQGFPGYRKTNIGTLEGAVVCNAEDLSRELAQDYDVFVNMHGSHFPLKAVEAYYGFLRKGRGYVQCFGAPLEYLYVYDKESNSYVCRNKQMSYYRELNIHSVMEVCQKAVTEFAVNEENEAAKDFTDVLLTTSTLNFVLHTTKDAYVENEWGSIGSMDTYMRPLVQGLDKKGQAISSPVVLMENRAGAYAGSRWIFVNADLTEEGYEKASELIAPLADFCACGHRELMVKPSFAMYENGEKPVIALSAQNFKRSSDWKVQFTLLRDQKAVWENEIFVKGAGYPSQVNVLIDIETVPGIYEIVTRWVSEDGEKQQIRQGFCVRDEAVLKSAVPVSCGRDYFVIDGKMQAVVGTTYMSGEVSRTYLQLPNVSNWLSDMQEMKRVGINWLRTGIWCNHRRFMLDDGHFDEQILRSIDAFVQTAATVGLHVTFTFFTFVPEAFEGSHPYLDRRSVEAQKRFVAKVVERHKDSTNIDWDLINEPFTSDHPSQKKKESDVLEDQDFRAYMAEKYGEISEMLWALDGNISKVPDFSALPLPLRENTNFEITDMAAGKNGIIWVDYTKYRMTMFYRWMEELKEMIREIAPGQLVTVGQDEALRAQRPSPLLYGKALDYNTQHSWWLLDDLVWDTQFAKADGKPLVVQETGIMYVEAPNGVPRRNEEDLAKLLRRKFAYAYGTKCAGAIHWLWNTNYHMNNANESNIGAIRCDKSRKPEFMVYERFARFFEKAQGMISDIKENEKTAVIFPYSNDFSNRSFAQHATTHLTKLLSYRLKVPFVGVSEFDLQPLRDHDFSVIFVPAAHHFDTKQFGELLEIVEEKGCTLVFTGPISYDEHFIKTDRAEGVVGETTLKALDRFEEVTYEGEEYLFSFDNTYMAKAFREEGTEGGCTVKQIGKGKLIWFSVPLELCCETEQLAGLYRKILDQCQVKVPFEITSDKKNARLLSGLFATKTEWENGNLYTLVNESSKELSVVIKDGVSSKEYAVSIPAEDVCLFLTDAEGNMTAEF
ncbi:MAG: cellulase family glycosylhydrolase [Clostridiales bacterium]|nr:cellulase family glycosylhydrolase [Clostridiales bacterium]